MVFENFSFVHYIEGDAQLQLNIFAGFLTSSRICFILVMLPGNLLLTREAFLPLNDSSSSCFYNSAFLNKNLFYCSKSIHMGAFAIVCFELEFQFIFIYFISGKFVSFVFLHVDSIPKW